MQSDYEVQRCTRQCAETERELQPGETFYAVLMQEGAKIVRYDYSAEAWSEPPEGAVGWWKSQMPSMSAKKANWAPNDVILHYFEQLDGNEEGLDVRYILALLMIRRRIVRLEETMTDDDGHEMLVLYCPKNENEYRAIVTPPSGERVTEIQNQLAELLFANAT